MKRDRHADRVSGVNDRLRRPTRAEFVEQIVEESRITIAPLRRRRQKVKPTA